MGIADVQDRIAGVHKHKLSHRDWMQEWYKVSIIFHVFFSKLPFCLS